jgi:hypothetical protein
MCGESSFGDLEDLKASFASTPSSSPSFASISAFLAASAAGLARFPSARLARRALFVLFLVSHERIGSLHGPVGQREEDLECVRLGHSLVAQSITDDWAADDSIAGDDQVWTFNDLPLLIDRARFLHPPVHEGHSSARLARDDNALEGRAR